MAILDFVKKKKDQLTGALNQGASGLHAYLSKPVGPRGQAFLQKSNALQQTAINKIANAPQFKFSENIQNPIGKFGASVAEGTLNIPSKIVQNYGKTLQDLESGKMKTGQGLLQFAGRTAENAIDVVSLGKAKVATQAGQQFLKGVRPLGQIMKEGWKEGKRVGTGYGAGYGLSTGVQDENATLKSVAQDTLISTLGGRYFGGVLGGGLPALGSLKGSIQNSIANRRKGAIRTERIPEHWQTRGIKTFSSDDAGKPGVLPKLSEGERFTGKVSPRGIDEVTQSKNYGVRVESRVPEQVVERGRKTPTLKDWGREVRGSLPRPGMSIQAVDDPLLQEAGKKGMPGEVSSDGLHTRGTDGKWHVTKKEGGNSFKVESLNEKTLTPDGSSYVVDVETSRAGKVSVVKSIVDGNGEKQFIESIPLEKAQAKYQTTDPATLAERMVNPFKDYNYKTDLYNKAQGGPTLKDWGKEVVDALPRPGMSIEDVSGGVPTRTRGVIESVKKSQNIAPELKSTVSGTYTPQSNQTTFREANDAISGGFEDAVYKAKTDDTIGRQSNAEAIDLIGKLQAAGRMQDAIDVVENLAKRGTEAGQSIQVLSAINRLTPDGVLMWAQRSIEKAKVASPEKFGNLRLTPEKAGIIRKIAETAQGLSGDEKTKETMKLIDEIQKIVPSSWAQKLTTLWKAGLLTGVKGAVGGSSIGNTTNAIIRKISDVPASAIDTVLSQVTGNRSKVFTLRGLFTGAKEGSREAVKNMRLGVGADDLSRKMDYQKVHFDTPAIQKYVDSVFNFYSAADRPFYHSALKNSLYDLSAVEGKNQGLKGKILKDFVEKTVKEPNDTILNLAIEEAKAAVFQNKTAIGSALSGLKQGLKKNGGAAGEIASEVIAPFTGVPSSVATAVHQYSPTGAVQGLYKAFVAANSGNFDRAAQRNLSEALGKGITGTGVMWLGTKLLDSGLMTLGYPSDPGERSLWEREGKIPYSIKVGGKWRSLNYTGSIMSLLAIGGEIQKRMNEGGDLASSVWSGVLGSGKAILGSSPLQGAQAGMNALTDPQRYGDSYLRNTASSIVPTLIKDFASAGDRVSREVNTISDAFKNKLPGMRNTLLPKRDVFGEVVENPAGPVSSIIDPLRSREAKTDPLTSELRRLQDADFGPTLSMPEEKIKAFGEEMVMTPEELDVYEKRVGTISKEAVSNLIASPQYQGLGDEQKKDLIDKTINDIRRAEKEKVISSGTAASGVDIPDGKLGGKTKPSNAEKDLAVYNFMQSDENAMEFGGRYYFKDDSAASGYRSKTIEMRGSEYSKEKMAQYKSNDDVGSWLKEADVLYKQYDKMLRAETDDLERLKIENDMRTLAEQFNKYKSYGGFTKPKKAAKPKILNLKNDADFILKKMNSDLKPLRAFGRSRTNIASVRKPTLRRPKFSK